MSRSTLPAMTCGGSDCDRPKRLAISAQATLRRTGRKGYAMVMGFMEGLLEKKVREEVFEPQRHRDTEKTGIVFSISLGVSGSIYVSSAQSRDRVNQQIHRDGRRCVQQVVVLADGECEHFVVERHLLWSHGAALALQAEHAVFHRGAEGLHA